MQASRGEADAKKPAHHAWRDHNQYCVAHRRAGQHDRSRSPHANTRCSNICSHGVERSCHKRRSRSHIYDSMVEPMSNVVDSAVCAIRRKLDADGGPSLIETRRGMGYMISDELP